MANLIRASTVILLAVALLALSSGLASASLCCEADRECNYNPEGFGTGDYPSCSAGWHCNFICRGPFGRGDGCCDENGECQETCDPVEYCGDGQCNNGETCSSCPDCPGPAEQFTVSWSGDTFTIRNNPCGEGSTTIRNCIYLMHEPLPHGDQTLAEADEFFVPDGEAVTRTYTRFDSYDCKLQIDTTTHACPQSGSPPQFNPLIYVRYYEEDYCPEIPETPNQPQCGDGRVEAPEQCETNSQCNDWNPATTDTCQSCVCRYTVPPIQPRCGDGQVNGNEQCEANSQCNDGNAATSDSCQSCQCVYTNLPRCGDGNVNPGEQCELDTQCNDYDSTTRDYCDACQCWHDVLPACGDGKLDTGEECESNYQCNDNNPYTFDTCSQCRCQHRDNQYCGNGIINPGEDCEGRGTNNNQYCTQSTSGCDGRRMQTRDAVGYCGEGCNCMQDSFASRCVKGQCGAECSQNSDCNDGNANTWDSCTESCGCTHVSGSACGNGKVEPGEACESDAQCGYGSRCIGCSCLKGSYCGDGKIDAGEACDLGVKINGAPCSARKGETCNYCTANCTYKTITGGSCGDGHVDYAEQCDVGEGNGVECSPRCGDSCLFCGTDCMVDYVDGDTCDVPDVIPVPTYESGMYNFPVTYYSGYNAGRNRAGICGDSIVSSGEECDDGSENGIECRPGCNSQCTYCSSTCKETLLKGTTCSKRQMPWDFMGQPICDGLAIAATRAIADTKCGGNGASITARVNQSDNNYAVQDACQVESAYVHVNFTGVKLIGGFSNLSLVLEHKESEATVRADVFWEGQWRQICTLRERSVDTFDKCVIPEKMIDENIEVRLRISRQAAGARASFDSIFLEVAYCSMRGNACGDSKVQLGEECDDGNTLNGDGCDETCAVERLICNPWNKCVDGKQTQICFNGNYVKNNVRNCGYQFSGDAFIIILLIVLLILILLFLFYPLIAVARRKRR